MDGNDSLSSMTREREEAAVGLNGSAEESRSCNQGGGQESAERHEPPLVTQREAEAAPVGSNEPAEKSRQCIFRVPKGNSREIANACRPCVISIGPYHHGESGLQEFRERKKRCLDTMLERTRPRDIRYENLFSLVAPKGEKIRQCYSESTDKFNQDELVDMMIRDGCFIIEFLRERFTVTDRISRTNFLEVLPFARDLLRLENQVPYFVLQDLFEATKAADGTTSLVDLACNFFSYLGEGSPIVHQRQVDVQPAHLLDLFRLSLTPSHQQHNRVDRRCYPRLNRSASDLHRVGVKFKPVESSTFLDIQLDRKSRALLIPRVAVKYDELRWILINMIAFEQCSGQAGGHVTAYAMFMGCLIRTAEDVRLLRDCRVISSFGMSNEDFAFFSDICKDVPPNIAETYLSSHIAILNEPPTYEWAHIYWAQLLNTLRHNPWSALSGLVTVVTLVGMLETVYTVLQYYHRR